MSPGDVPYYDNAFLQGLQDQGYILPGEIPHYDASSWQRMLNQGYFAGQRIHIDIRATGQHFERAPQFAAELVSLNVDAIFVIGGLLVKTMQDAIAKSNKATPIIFGPEYDPVGKGFVASLARPGGNTTGVALADPSFDPKRLELLKETFPRLTRVAYLTNSVFDPDYFRQSDPLMYAAARAMKIRLVILDINNPGDLEKAFVQIDSRRIEGIVIPSRIPPLLIVSREQLIDLVAKRRLPTVYGDVIFVDDGGLMSYGPSLAALKRRSASLVAKILQGAKAGDIPVEQASTFELVVNLKTARALRLTIPTDVLSRADRVIR
jgi:putative ABC transport system substrate-binding protein